MAKKTTTEEQDNKAVDETAFFLPEHGITVKATSTEEVEKMLERQADKQETGDGE